MVGAIDPLCVGTLLKSEDHVSESEVEPERDDHDQLSNWLILEADPDVIEIRDTGSYEVDDLQEASLEAGGGHQPSGQQQQDCQI